MGTNLKSLEWEDKAERQSTDNGGISKGRVRCSQKMDLRKGDLKGEKETCSGCVKLFNLLYKGVRNATLFK